MAIKKVKIGDFPPLATIIGNETLPLGRASDGVGVGVSMDEFKDWIGFEQFEGVVPKKAPSSITGTSSDALFYVANAGSYMLNGVLNTLTEPINYLFWDKVSWDILEIDIEPDYKQLHTQFVYEWMAASAGGDYAFDSEGFFTGGELRWTDGSVGYIDNVVVTDGRYTSIRFNRPVSENRYITLRFEYSGDYLNRVRTETTGY